MRKLAKLALLVALVAGFGSCRGQSDEGEVALTLEPSTTIIEANGEDSVTFKVLYGAVDVTLDAQVILVSPSDFGWMGGAFSIEEAGTYVFKATYQGYESPEVSITANPVAGAHISRFERQICVMEFTGAWCSNCPDGYRSLNGILSNPYAGWKDRVHIIALHDNTGGTDPMGITLTNTLFSHYKLAGFPSYVTDMREGGLLTSEGIQGVKPSLERSDEEFPAKCAVKISSSLAGRELTVDVGLFAELAGDYAVSVWLLEDGIDAPQKDGSIDYDSWTHNHVARALVSNNWKGDLLGAVAAEQESSKSYTYTLPAEWKPENMSIMALAIDAEGYVNNVAVCAVGEGAEYRYLTE